MKQIFFLLTLVVALPAFSQKIDESEVPEAVMNSLNKEYEDIKVKGWELADDQYHAKARVDGATAFISFAPEGEYLKISFPLDPRELPSALLAYVDEHFTNVNFALSDLVEDKDGKEYYFVELQKEGVAQGKLSELKFDYMGELIDRVDFQPVEAPKTEVAERGRPERQRREKPAVEEEVIEKSRGIDESQVPEKVKTYFTRRFRMAEDLVWDTMGENYVASFYQYDLISEAQFDKEGEWILTKQEMAPDRLYSPISRYLAEEYPGFRLDYAEKITKADRDINYYVEISEKIRGIDPDPVTRLYFDKTGRVTRAEEPELPEEQYEEYDYLDDPQFEAEIEDDLDELAGPRKVENPTIRESELPSGIPDYIYPKYRAIKIIETVLDEDPEWGSVYRVLVSKEGLGQDAYELYFDLRGELLQDNIPEDAFKIKDSEEVMEDEEDIFYEDRTKISSSEVPDAVTTYFSRRFPRAEEVNWLEEDNGYFTSQFFYRDLKHQTTFDKEGTLLRTKTEMFLDRVYRPILMYVDEYYPKYKIDYAEKIIRKDRVNYYYIELYTKKRDLPEFQYLYFDKMGKPIDEEPEL